MKSIDDVVNSFQTISLKEMDDIALLDRTDTKFTFTEEHLVDVLEAIKSDYRILEVNGKRSTDYETLYFDNDQFDFYIRHHNEKLNRYKARFRKYVESNLVFFEVKFKSNKGRTIKKRIKENEISLSMGDSEKELFENVTHLNANDFSPKLWVNYTRRTFVSNRHDERLTVDTNLVFREVNGGVTKLASPLQGLVIAEVKQKKVSFSSPFMRFMHSQHTRKLSMSKYCIGVATLHPELKHNNFKPKFLTINKIVNGNNDSSARV